MEQITTQFICVQLNTSGEPWWRHDTLSGYMSTSKKLLIGGGTMIWKDLYKIGWRCLKVDVNIKTWKP